MRVIVSKMQSIKVFLTIILIVWAKIDLYFAAKSTEAGVNSFIIFALGFLFAARSADKFIEKNKKV